MSISPARPDRAGRHQRQSMLRDLAQQAAAHPRIEQAVLGAIRAELPGVIEGLLREMYRGETVRLYVPKRTCDIAERNQRIRAMAAPPSSMSTAQIAARERLTQRQVQRVLAGIE